ncbi:SDR family oxidoreductase [Actinospongicola halichondriae]|uniref:SDR family oxidoreductase n=1 Tax=Actinospongicola halichondriae TaxID=3236844 RepID=UPI003D5D3DCA
MGLCDGRVAIVTGAGRGIGREHALMLAEHGAAVVVNDMGGTPEGNGGDLSPAQQVVAEIEAMGGRAVANGADVSDWDDAKAMVDQAIDTFGRLDVLVNNAGILRDRMMVNMTEDEWDAVVRVHLKGTFAPARHAGAHWRERAKAGETNDARIINTTSVSGIYGNPGQTNYGAAKMGIAGFTIIAAMELARYGVTVNAISPGALTRLTEALRAEPPSEEEREAASPRWIAPICTWLASPESRNVTGRVFQVHGSEIAIAESWHRGPTEQNPDDPTAMADVVARLMADARPNADMAGNDAVGPGRPGPTI